MPMPTPNESETKEDFIARFMANEEMKTEHPEEDARMAAANKQWDEKPAATPADADAIAAEDDEKKPVTATAEGDEEKDEADEELQGSEHVAPQRDPGDFTSVDELWSNEGVRGVGGPLTSEPDAGTQVQAVRFDAEKFTADEAKAWLEENGYTADGFEEAAGTSAPETPGTVAGEHEDKEKEKQLASAYQHIAEISDPVQYDDFINQYAGGVEKVYGVKLPDGEPELQAICFDSGTFTPEQAASWLEMRGFNELKITPAEEDTTSNGVALAMKIDDIEALRPGTFQSVTGEVDVTDEDIEAAVNNFADNPDVPAVLGHRVDTDTPAVGWVSRMKIVGQKLVLALKNVPAHVAEMISDKSVRKVSVGFSRDPELGVVIKHVGLLGAHPPAVKGLADIPEATLAAARAAEFVLTYEEGEDTMGNNSALAEARSVLAAVRKEGAAARKDRASARGEIVAFARERKTESLAGTAEKLRVEGRLPPAAIPLFLALGQLLLRNDPLGRGVVTLAASDGVAAQKMPGWQLLAKLGEALPVNTAFGERGLAGGEPQPSTNSERRREEMGRIHLADWKETEVLQKEYPKSEEYVELQLAADGFEKPVAPKKPGAAKGK